MIKALFKTYRFGFNGVEKSDEINQGDYEFSARIYDSKIGRWLSLDPLAAKYPSLSPYNFCANNPIMFVDPDGEIIVVPDGSKVKVKGYLKDAFGDKSKTIFKIILLLIVLHFNTVLLSQNNKKITLIIKNKSDTSLRLPIRDDFPEIKPVLHKTESISDTLFVFYNNEIPIYFKQRPHSTDSFPTWSFWAVEPHKKRIYFVSFDINVDNVSTIVLYNFKTSFYFTRKKELIFEFKG